MTINRAKGGFFSDAQLRFLYHPAQFSDLIQLPFSKDNFAAQIASKGKTYTSTQRKLLHAALSDAYGTIETTSLVQQNLSNLALENTYTVTTGHQLSIFTGPLYFIYKILNAIKLAEELKKNHPAFNFVPVYWMASEDHDFEEIKSIELFGKPIAWNTEQRGPVGRFQLEGFDEVKQHVLSFFKAEQLEELTSLFAKYTGKNLAEATFRFVNELFQDYGLVIIDGDHPELKKSFAPIIEKELFTNFAQSAVEATNEKIKAHGLKEQIQARPINLFYIEDGKRERINRSENGFAIENVGTYSEDDIRSLLNAHPERFSPNVVLRPVYQELLLPNLCYIGGTGEIAYWLQLKEVFDAAEVVFPLLSVRNSLLFIDGISKSKMEKVGYEVVDSFLPVEELKKDFLQRNSSEELNFEFAHELMEQLRTQMVEKVKQVDASLEQMVESESTKMSKQISFVEERIRKSIKSKHDQSLLAIEQFKNRLFPGNSLQERSVNLFSMLGNHSVKDRIQHFYEAIDPFENDIIILSE
ncbi:MAG: bacillithiol biosynthesis cysteine-adding enzyme BshC [Bacteroidota bacterium]